MAGEAVALIRDIDLFEQLDRWLGEKLQTRLRFAADANSALELLHQQRVPTLLVDSRIDSCDGEAQRLFAALQASDTSGLNLVTVGDGVLPTAIAHTLDLFGMEHIPVDQTTIRWDGVSERLPRVFTALRARVLPRTKHVEAGGVSVTTYTSDFFPVLDDLLRVTHRDVTLLLVGETGTGKTTLARFIHNRSPRRERAFQHLACGTLPCDLIESELFGHTRGAFTGAERNKIGRFQAAGRGTLLLDEIDVLDLKQQVKLLRVIETGEYELVGSTETHVSEARLIVASNVNLEDLVEAGQFRCDLYYRLNVLEFRLPSLRNRPLDIAPLAVQFVEESCQEHGIAIRGVHRDFLACLRKYQWPGNLRELKNHIRRAVLFCDDDVLTVKDLAPKIVQAQFQSNGSNGESSTPAHDETRTWTIADRVAQTERDYLEQALRQHGNNRTRTAEALGLSRVGLYKKLRRLGLMGAAE